MESTQNQHPVHIDSAPEGLVICVQLACFFLYVLGGASSAVAPKRDELNNCATLVECILSIVYGKSLKAHLSPGFVLSCSLVAVSIDIQGQGTTRHGPRRGNIRAFLAYFCLPGPGG